MVFKSEFNMKFPRKLYNIFTFLKYLLLGLMAISPILKSQFTTLQTILKFVFSQYFFKS